MSHIAGVALLLQLLLPRQVLRSGSVMECRECLLHESGSVITGR